MILISLFYFYGRWAKIPLLVDMLDGINRRADLVENWQEISKSLPKKIQGRGCKIESAVLSPDKKKIAICMEVRTLLGLKKRYAGFLYSLVNQSVLSRITLGRRKSNQWNLEE